MADLKLIEAFVAEVQAKTNEYHEYMGFGEHMAVKIEYTVGRKYVRIIRADVHGSSRSVYCFADLEGNLYKAAGWKGPAKNIRGNIEAVLATGGITNSEIYSFGSVK